MGTFKKQISQHTQKEFMGKIYTQWSEIVIYPSVWKAKYPSCFSFKEGNFGQRKSSNTFAPKKFETLLNIHSVSTDAFFSRWGQECPAH